LNARAGNEAPDEIELALPDLAAGPELSLDAVTGKIDEPSRDQGYTSPFMAYDVST
jgi:hypothetical protein